MIPSPSTYPLLITVRAIDRSSTNPHSDCMSRSSASICVDVCSLMSTTFRLLSRVSSTLLLPHCSLQAVLLLLNMLSFSSALQSCCRTYCAVCSAHSCVLVASALLLLRMICGCMPPCQKFSEGREKERTSHVREHTGYFPTVIQTSPTALELEEGGCIQDHGDMWRHGRRRA